MASCRRASDTMDIASLKQYSEYEWVIPASGDMRVPGIIYGSETLIRSMDDKSGPGLGTQYQAKLGRCFFRVGLQAGERSRLTNDS